MEQSENSQEPQNTQGSFPNLVQQEPLDSGIQPQSKDRLPPQNLIDAIDQDENNPFNADNTLMFDDFQHQPVDIQQPYDFDQEDISIIHQFASSHQKPSLKVKVQNSSPVNNSSQNQKPTGDSSTKIRDDQPSGSMLDPRQYSGNQDMLLQSQQNNQNSNSQNHQDTSAISRKSRQNGVINQKVTKDLVRFDLSEQFGGPSRRAQGGFGLTRNKSTNLLENNRYAQDYHFQQNHRNNQSSDRMLQEIEESPQRMVSTFKPSGMDDSNDQSLRRRPQGAPLTNRNSSVNNAMRGQKEFSISQGIQHAKMNELMKPVYFNVMLAGEAGTGKSKFLEMFLEKAFNQRNVVQHDKIQITEYVTEKKEDGVRFVLNMIDCPGYCNQKPVKEWHSEIKKYFMQKEDTYEDLKRMSIREKSLSMKNIIDGRVHVCLYFFSGPRLKTNDVIYMKKLSKYVNIIPVFSCEQDLELEEVEDLKQQIQREAQDYQLDWFSIDKSVGGIQSVVQRAQIQSIEPYPPFYFYSGSEEAQDDVAVVDFKLLVTLLMGYLSLPLIHRTDVILALKNQKGAKKKKRYEQQEIDNKINIGVGVALGLGVLGAIMVARKVLN